MRKIDTLIFLVVWQILSYNNNIWKDTYTKLIWQDEKYTIDEIKASNFNKIGNLNHAKKYCKNLHIGNYSDWYLPRIEQLEKLYFKKTHLKNVDYSFEYWSSSKATNDDENYNRFWTIDFSNGFMGNYTGKHSLLIRCVRDDDE